MQTRINIGHSMVPPHQMVMSCGTNPRALRSVERPATLRKSLTDGRVQQTERFFFKVRKLLTDDTSHNPEVDFDVSYFVYIIFRHSSCQQKCPPQIRGNTWSLKIWSPIGHHLVDKFHSEEFVFTSFQGPVPPLKTRPPKVLVSTLLIRTFRKSHVKDPQEVPFFKDRAAPRLHGILSMFMEKRIKWSSPSIAFLRTLEFCVDRI